jgi:hypothetical protein
MAVKPEPKCSLCHDLGHACIYEYIYNDGTQKTSGPYRHFSDQNDAIYCAVCHKVGWEAYYEPVGADLLLRALREHRKVCSGKPSERTDGEISIYVHEEDEFLLTLEMDKDGEYTGRWIPGPRQMGA